MKSCLDTIKWSEIRALFPNVIFVLAGVFLLGCTTDPKVQVLNSLEENTSQADESMKVYVVTALDGCGACVQSTVNLIERNIDQKGMVFIVSGRSRKQLKMKFSPSTILHPNFVFDSNQVAISKKIIESIYPKILMVENNRVVDERTLHFTNAERFFSDAIAFLNGSELQLKE